MKRLVFIILSLFVVSFAKAQIAIDTLNTEALNNLLIEQVERLAEDGDEDADYEDLLENSWQTCCRAFGRWRYGSGIRRCSC